MAASLARSSPHPPSVVASPALLTRLEGVDAVMRRRLRNGPRNCRGSLWLCASEGFVWAPFTSVLAVTPALPCASCRQRFSLSLPLFLLYLFLYFPRSHGDCRGAEATQQRAECACVCVCVCRCCTFVHASPYRRSFLCCAFFLFWHAHFARFRLHLCDASTTRWRCASRCRLSQDPVPPHDEGKQKARPPSLRQTPNHL